MLEGRKVSEIMDQISANDFEKVEKLELSLGQVYDLIIHLFFG